MLGGGDSLIAHRGAEESQSVEVVYEQTEIGSAFVGEATMVDSTKQLIGRLKGGEK